MANTKPNNNIVDIDLSATRKKRVRINGDDNAILELNTSDMNIVNRLNVALPKLNELQDKAFSTDGDDEDTFAKLAEVDTEMRKYIDYIFNANVSEVTASDGSMYDMFNGVFRFEYIIEALLKLYEDNIQAETDAVQKRFEKHTAKYSKGKK